MGTTAECGRTHPGPCAWVGKGGPLEPICLQPERPEPPVTADHTPDMTDDLEVARLLAEHDAALRAECDVLRGQTARVEALYGGEPPPVLIGDTKIVRVTHRDRRLGCDITESMLRVDDVRAALYPQDRDHERTSG